ncbi:MAG TPA: sugar ABC transporter permease [Anaerolineales bacterium]|nr:sugar ABC transporter permease [Anaerolineales bacterium]
MKPLSTRTALIIASFWHGLVSLLLAGVILSLWMGNTFGDIAVWVKWVLTGLMLALAVGNGLASLWLAQRKSQGRIASLASNYLLLVIALSLDLHFLGVFTGIDALGNTFGAGLPALILAGAGYFISVQGEDRPKTARTFKWVGQALMAVGGIVFLWQIQTLSGLFFLGKALLASPLCMLLTTLIILCAMGLWLIWRRPTAEALGVSHMQDEALNGYLFLSPNFLGFLFFFAGPLLLSLYVSFTNWDAFGTRDWIGLTNYARIFNLTVQPLTSADQLARTAIDVKIYDELTRVNLFGNYFIVGAQDKVFWLAMRNTLLYVLFTVPLSVIPALVLAVILNSPLPGMRFYRTIFFIPSIAAVVGIGLVWQWLYNAAIGWVNYFITVGTGFLHISDPQIRWLSDAGTAMLAVVIMAAWQTMGFNSVLFLAGLQNISRELYEAATVDGAGNWAKFWKITLPLLAPTTFFVVSTTTIQALQVFEPIYILTNPLGGPNNSTLTLVPFLYQKGFQDFKQGYASAVAWVLFLVIFIFTLAQFQRQSKAEGN